MLIIRSKWHWDIPKNMLLSSNSAVTAKLELQQHISAGLLRINFQSVFIFQKRVS